MKDGGKAFPVVLADQCYSGGMTLRDYFAGQALVLFGPFSTFDEIFNKHEMMAKKAYKFADAMLAEREEKTTEGKDEKQSD